MSQPSLLWVNLNVAARSAAPPMELARRCQIRATDYRAMFAGDAIGMTPDIICFDFDFPDLKGLKLIPETKARFPSLPILMLTLQHSEELAVWAFRSRVFDYLVKPLRAQELERCMTQLQLILQARRQQQCRRPESTAAAAPAEARYQAKVPAESRLQLAISYVAQHYSRRVMERDVASLCKMSLHRFSREFRVRFGVTFQDYLCMHRIGEAQRLLSNPLMPVADVAATVGFSDPSYFARVFKRHCGITPSAFRDARTLSPEFDIKARPAPGLGRALARSLALILPPPVAIDMAV